MKFFSFPSVVVSLSVCLGVHHVYAHGGQVARQSVSKSRLVSAQFYHEISMLAQNLAEAERVLYANHRVEEKLLHLLAQAKKTTLTQPALDPDTGMIDPAATTVEEVFLSEDGKMVNFRPQDPQKLLDPIAGQDFITALEKLHRWHQQRLHQFDSERGVYRVDFHVFVYRYPDYAFMMQDKEATLLKRRAADRILAALGAEPAAWEELPRADFPKSKTHIVGEFAGEILAMKIESADFYQSLERLTQEFRRAEQELYRAYDVAQKVNEHLLWRGIEGDFYGGKLSSIAHDSVKAHDLLASAVGPEYIAELEVLFTDYLEKAVKLPFFWDHAERTSLWGTNYATLLAERRIAFKLKGHVVDNLIIELKSIAIRWSCP